MIYTSAVTCLSSGLSKNNKIMSMFVLFSWLFGHFESLFFFEIGETAQIRTNSSFTHQMS